MGSSPSVVKHVKASPAPLVPTPARTQGHAEPKPDERVPSRSSRPSAHAAQGRQRHGQAVTAKLTIASIGNRSGGRIFIEDIYPLVDCGCFPVKRIVDEPIDVWADIFRTATRCLRQTCFGVTSMTRN